MIMTPVKPQNKHKIEVNVIGRISIDNNPKIHGIGIARSELTVINMQL